MKTKVLLSILLFIGMVDTTYSQGSWTPLANFGGGPRYGAVAISIDGKGYVGLGTNNSGYVPDFWEYNPVTNVWTQKADFPGGVRTTSAGFTIGDKGYVSGGSYSVGDVNWVWYKDLWQYDPTTNTWLQKASLPDVDEMGNVVRGRGLAVAFTLNNKGYMGTGTYRTNRYTTAEYLSDFWEYNATTDSWTKKASVPLKGRTNATGISIGDRGYIGLGFYWYDTRLKDWWEYNPATDSWVQKADFEGTQRYGACSLSIGGKGYVGAGSYYSYFNDFWEYNPGTNDWTQLSNTPGDARSNPTVFTIGSKGYYGLGGNSTGALTDFWEFRPANIPSTLLCPADTIVSAGSTRCDAVVNGLDPIIDVGEISEVVEYSMITQGVEMSGKGSVNGFTFPKGITTVTYRVPQNPGLQCQFTVSVLDQTAPVIECPASYTLCFEDSRNYIIPSLIASDNCGIQSYTFTISGATSRTGSGQDASGYFHVGESYIDWIVTDSAGNQSTCKTTVVVDLKLFVRIPECYAVWPGGKPNTLYLGYGPSSLKLNALAFGGKPFPGYKYNYLWSTGEVSPSIIVSPSSPGTYAYTLMVTDSYGCQQTATTTVTVIDVRCGNNLNKVEVCIDRAASHSNPHTLCVSKNAVPAQLFTGASLGDCNADNDQGDHANALTDPASSDPLVNIYPNPNNGTFGVFVNNATNTPVEVSIINSFGTVVLQKTADGEQTIPIEIPSATPGIYIVRAVYDGEVHTYRMIVK